MRYTSLTKITRTKFWVSTYQSVCVGEDLATVKNYPKVLLVALMSMGRHKERTCYHTNCVFTQPLLRATSTIAYVQNSKIGILLIYYFFLTCAIGTSWRYYLLWNINPPTSVRMVILNLPFISAGRTLDFYMLPMVCKGHAPRKFT